MMLCWGIGSNSYMTAEYAERKKRDVRAFIRFQAADAGRWVGKN